MSSSRLSSAVAILAPMLVAALAPPVARAEGKCTGHAVMAGKKVEMSHCVVSYFDDQHSVAIWFDAQPIPADKAAAFATSAYSGEMGRQMVQVSFCPGGAGTTPDPKAVKSVQIDIADGPSWVLDVPKQEAKIDRLGGKLALGGQLTGHLLVQRQSDGQPYAFDLAFDLALPATSAAAGVTCGAAE